MYNGKDTVTFWSGISAASANSGHGYGNVTFLDTSYNNFMTVCPQLGLVTPENTEYLCEADFHEAYITDRNTILVSAYNATQTDLTSVGGPKDGWVFDSLFFEIEPESGNVFFRWSALEYISVNDTKEPLAAAGRNQSLPFDCFHINSVVNFGNEWLVNLWNTWSTYMLTAEGDVIWRIQGDTGGDFGPLPDDARFVCIKKDSSSTHPESAPRELEG